jgi:hypothetical protein
LPSCHLHLTQHPLCSAASLIAVLGFADTLLRLLAFQVRPAPSKREEKPRHPYQTPIAPQLCLSILPRLLVPTRHPLRLVHSAHEDHAVAENGALQQPQWLGAVGGPAFLFGPSQCHGSEFQPTDRRTDGQTDGRTALHFRGGTHWPTGPKGLPPWRDKRAMVTDFQDARGAERSAATVHPVPLHQASACTRYWHGLQRANR